MKLLEPLLAAKSRDFMVIKAHAAGPRQLFVALEAFVHESKDAATCVVSVDLDTLAVDLVHEVAGSSIDYLHAAGWHGLLQVDAVIEIGGKKPVVTKVKLGTGPTAFGNRLTALARVADTTLVCGTRELDGHVLDGFVARVAGGKLATIMESSSRCPPGPLGALCVGKEHIYAAGGVQQLDGTYVMFRGDMRTFSTATAVGANEVLSLHEKADGSVMIGCDRAAWLYEHGKPARSLTGITMRVDGAIEHRGVELWMSHDSHEQLVLWRRTGTKLTKAYKTKHHYIGYRRAPEARMTATDDLLVVTNKDRIHVFDGKSWSQLALQPNRKLFKRLPAAMKK